MGLIYLNCDYHYPYTATTYKNGSMEGTTVEIATIKGNVKVSC